ncbi:MAG: hypothetical protein NTY37_05245 [Methanothrix sp.]|nr:hypothetical protein [Methanothrix sp.]
MHIRLINQRVAFPPAAFPAIFAAEKDLGGNLGEEGFRNFSGKPLHE